MSDTPLKDALAKLDTLPANEAQVGGFLTQDNAGAAASISVGDDKKDLAAAGGYTKNTGWFAALRARWRF